MAAAARLAVSHYLVLSDDADDFLTQLRQVMGLRWEATTIAAQVVSSQE